MKCKYCDKEATRLHARHDTGELEYLFEDSYETLHNTINEISDIIDTIKKNRQRR